MDEPLTATDLLELQNLVSDYCLAADYRQAEVVRDLFAADAVLSFSHSPAGLPTAIEGREAIVAQMEGYYRLSEEREREGRGARHFATTSRFEVVDGEVRGRTGLLVTRMSPSGDGGGTVLWVGATGVYHDRFVREDGAWRFAERRLEYDPPGPVRD